MEKRINTDVLVIGGAGAGLRAALEAKANGADVVLASKMPAGGISSTLHTAGWITCSTEASEDELFRQIVHTGGYLNNQRLVEVLVRDVVRRIPELEEFGVPVLEREGRDPDMPGHYVIPRIPDKPRGYAMLNPMRAKAEEMGINILDNTPISNLLTANNTVVGAVGIDLDAMQLLIISAKATVLATGGGAYAFQRNNNPPGITGDGFCLAFRAGAELVDIECISHNFPRSMLQAIFEVKGDPPGSLLDAGMAHYFLGGVKIDEECRTNITGLFAAGEVTGGIFGAGRIGGSAMADIIVFGARAGDSATKRAKEMDVPDPDEPQIRAEKEKFERIMQHNEIPPADVFARLRSILWKYMGVVKTEGILNQGLEKLSEMEAEVLNMRARSASEVRAVIEASNILELGRIIATASLVRKETRGNYWRSDYPEPDNDNWLKNVVVYRKGEEIMTKIEPAVMTRVHKPVRPPIGEGCFGYFPRLYIAHEADRRK